MLCRLWASTRLIAKSVVMETKNDDKVEKEEIKKSRVKYSLPRRHSGHMLDICLSISSASRMQV